MTTETPEYLLWIDLETTGLDREACHILEVAAVLTDLNFDVLGEYEALVAAPADAVMKADSYAQEMHRKSGLWGDWWGEYGARNLTGHGSVEASIRSLLRKVEGEASFTLAGSGIGVYDVPILRRVFPWLLSEFTYHVHDVGVMRRAYQRATGRYLTEHAEPAHRAMADVQQSLTEGRAFCQLFRDHAGIQEPIWTQESDRV